MGPPHKFLTALISPHISLSTLFCKISSTSSFFPFNSTAIPLLSRAKTRAAKVSTALLKEGRCLCQSSDSPFPSILPPSPPIHRREIHTQVSAARNPRERWRLSEPPPGISRRFLAPKRRLPAAPANSAEVAAVVLGLDPVYAGAWPGRVRWFSASS